MKLRRNTPDNARSLRWASGGAVAAAALLAGCSGSLGGEAGSGLGEGSATPTTMNPDGSRVITNPDGSTTIINADGTTTTIPAGQEPGGTATGATVVTNPNGTTTVTNPDGTTTTIDSVSGCVPGVPATTQLPRLTRVQYDNTIRDLVGITSNPSAMLAPDDTGPVDQRAWDGYKLAAQTVAAEVMADPTARGVALTCTTADDACAAQFVADFGLRAFRRPLTDAENTRFLAMYTNRATLTETGSFDEAIHLILRSFLQSPSFLTRAEITEAAEGEYYALSGYEVASRLSYTLWGSMPDAPLFAAAQAGTLSTKEGILAEATRMLQDPKARAQVASFHREYAHMGEATRWAQIDHDTSLYPAFNATQVPAMVAETEAIFEHITFDAGGSFADLLTTNVAFVNSATAPLYDLDASGLGADLTQTTLDGSRPGILTRVGFLASQAKFDRSSPIYRGTFVQEGVLCTEFGNPPAGAASTPLPTDLATNRERVDAQTAGAECMGCHHGVINPTGHTFEGFDAIGRVRTMDNGVAVNTAATVPVGAGTIEVANAQELIASLATAPEAQRCYAKRWVEYAYERVPNAQDACTVDAMSLKLAAGGYRIVDLIADLTQSDSFRLRAVEVTQ